MTEFVRLLTAAVYKPHLQGTDKIRSLYSIDRETSSKRNVIFIQPASFGEGLYSFFIYFLVKCFFCTKLMQYMGRDQRFSLICESNVKYPTLFFGQVRTRAEECSRALNVLEDIHHGRPVENLAGPHSVLNGLKVNFEASQYSLI